MEAELSVPLVKLQAKPENRETLAEILQRQCSASVRDFVWHLPFMEQRKPVDYGELTQALGALVPNFYKDQPPAWVIAESERLGRVFSLVEDSEELKNPHEVFKSLLPDRLQTDKELGQIINSLVRGVSKYEELVQLAGRLGTRLPLPEPLKPLIDNLMASSADEGSNYMDLGGVQTPGAGGGAGGGKEGRESEEQTEKRTESTRSGGRGARARSLTVAARAVLIVVIIGSVVVNRGAEEIQYRASSGDIAGDINKEFRPEYNKMKQRFVDKLGASAAEQKEGVTRFLIDRILPTDDEKLWATKDGWRKAQHDAHLSLDRHLVNIKAFMDAMKDLGLTAEQLNVDNDGQAAVRMLQELNTTGKTSPQIKSTLTRFYDNHHKEVG